MLEGEKTLLKLSFLCTENCNHLQKAAESAGVIERERV